MFGPVLEEGLPYVRTVGVDNKVVTTSWIDGSPLLDTEWYTFSLSLCTSATERLYIVSCLVIFLSLRLRIVVIIL